MLRPHTSLFNAATDAPDAGGSGDTVTKATIGQQLRAALSTKADLTARLDTANASLQSVTTERDEARAPLATAMARVTDLEAQLSDVNAALGDHEKEVAKLKAAEKDLATRAAAKSKEHVASLGFPAAALPNPDPKISQAQELTPAEFNALDHVARNEFFRAGGKLIAA